MKRVNSCLAVLALLVVAAAVCVVQTIESGELMTSRSFASTFMLEGLVAGVLSAAALSLLRRRYSQPGSAITRPASS